MATTDYALTHAPVSPMLAPRLTVAGEIAKFARTKPVGAVGGGIILAMLRHPRLSGLLLRKALFTTLR